MLIDENSSKLVRVFSDIRARGVRYGLLGSYFDLPNSYEGSDIDVVVELGDQDLFILIGIKQDLEERFEIPVEIVSYRNRMNQFLKARINKEAVYV